MQQTKQILVIGNGMVGHHFVDQLRAKDPLAQITVLCGEAQLAYDRVHLSGYFSGTSAEQLALTTEEAYQAANIQYHLNCWVEQINREQQLVLTSQGGSFYYDELVLATGSYAFVPPIPGNDQPHCLVYRTLQDLDAIAQSAALSKVGVVIGGGLLGLEAANALKQLGLHTHVVEFAPQLMAVQLDQGGGQMLSQKITELGVQVHTGKATQAIVAGAECRYQLQFADGESLETDLVLFSAGIRPYDQLARSCGLAVGERGGIVVNDQCQTSDPHIYAIGECALWQQKIFGLVAPGYQMARVVVSQLTGGELSFTGADMSTKLKLLGVEVGSIGDAHARTPGALSYVFTDPRAQVYKKMVVSSDGKRLLGAVLVGDTSNYDSLLHYALNDMLLPKQPEQLILPAASGAPLAALTLPNNATICSCHNVAKGDIVAAMDSGCCDLASIKSCTKASTGCGGCTALLKSVVDDELKSRGVEVKNHLCEHFAYSRQELLHLVQVGGIKTFAELLSRHGQGLGCDICKPTVGSILASSWNDYVLKKPHVGLQDTNDTFLANMQKDGSYSVVPRIAGGEITAEKLLVIGQVALDFNLYTKITGGQRIDLFGARLEQLPAIWQRLVDAGFETGHAYGKSLRTVKSCVGSTWCRYGVQDSVGQAIAIENRYKGLRAPHKIKMAVSGCTRECAEAQSKDIGIIATENGWNLYVCGNGGMRPRHADLFATDLDTDTLIRYIDRILMLYIRTADRLQRTSVWMEKLDGGLDYLRKVIIDDELGIAAELENQMAALVNTYACEWKATLENPQALKRFRQFVNSPDADENIVFVEERSQIRPATAEEKRQWLQQIPIIQLSTSELPVKALAEEN
ncbi:MAG: nitrite reductase large subunit NirB [Gammaproteobacteria bacterium]|nr:nitrite reductase large subunit NirB [Gammaproteobacteria bacterium]MBU2059362.1 nitrite reductase large subunit NirB [Gammaproteobacteria bacterium]MBU2175258.1 nitrite reductase large subunit NirB [Gammaproteobacteria bacterium]MBU2247466.1 nitrite reductase large subunit NirB [Gammaproteobacteria bacterium]MBU2346267.1 nitrite reductase large subunit NirB [Gammaproteobacteria bacterium]